MTATYYPIAIDLLNKVKAWRDCEGNDGFPPDVREGIDALLSAHEVRASGTYAEQVERTSQPPTASQPSDLRDWKFEVIDAATPYCLSCEKEGHRTEECNSTHGFNTPQEIELSRLAWIANGQYRPLATPQPPAASQPSDLTLKALTLAHALCQRSTAEDCNDITAHTIEAALRAASAINGEWWCEEHPEKPMGHDGCTGAGIPTCAQIPMLVTLLRHARQKTRETEAMRDEMASGMRNFLAAPVLPTKE